MRDILLVGVHVQLDIDSGNDITDLPTPIEKQSRRANKHVFQLESKWKEKLEILSEMTKIVKDFMEVSKARHLANEGKKQTASMNIDESFVWWGVIALPLTKLFRCSTYMIT